MYLDLERESLTDGKFFFSGGYIFVSVEKARQLLEKNEPVFLVDQHWIDNMGSGKQNLTVVTLPPSQ